MAEEELKTEVQSASRSEKKNLVKLPVSSCRNYLDPKEMVNVVYMKLWKCLGPEKGKFVKF